MRETILRIDLNTKTCTAEPYEFTETADYGRGLLLKLVRESISDDTDRYSSDNVIVLVPGHFTGCKAPSACRALIGTCEGRGKGLTVCNTTGDMPQFLGSLKIAGVVITGKSEDPGTVVKIGPDGVTFDAFPELKDRYTSEIIHTLRDHYGQKAAIIGATEAGDRRMSLATFFCTYTYGEPEYHCPRTGWGDIWGSKNLRALVVTSDGVFDRPIHDPDNFWKLARSLTQDIINDEVCGSALPSYGSITIMKILKSRASLAELEAEEQANRAKASAPNTAPVSGKSESGAASECKCSSKPKNLNCAPMCVIGCLNKHTASDGRQYHSPAQAEVEGALTNCFGINDFDLAKEIQFRASEIGIVGTEFVTACKMYAECLEIEDAPDHLLEWLEEIRLGTPVGRLIASRTHGIASIYKDLPVEQWLDRKAIQDESLFSVRLANKFPGLGDMDPYDLLYAQIFVLENLGFCIFSSFALLDKPEVFYKIAEMFEARAGYAQTPEQLLKYAAECIAREREFEAERWKSAQDTNVPPFTRVLYRYFDKNR